MSCKKIYTLVFICEMNKIPYCMSKISHQVIIWKCKESHIFFKNIWTEISTYEK